MSCSCPAYISIRQYIPANNSSASVQEYVKVVVFSKNVEVIHSIAKFLYLACKRRSWSEYEGFPIFFPFPYRLIINVGARACWCRCVCVRACACVGACVYVCIHVCVRVRARATVVGYFSVFTLRLFFVFSEAV